MAKAIAFVAPQLVVGKLNLEHLTRDKKQVVVKFVFLNIVIVI